MVYKLVEIDGEGKIKLSQGKKTYPMAKQVDRRRDGQGLFRGDVVMRSDETAEGERLLIPIVRARPPGQRVAGPEDHPGPVRRPARLPPRQPQESRYATLSYPISYSDLLEAEALRLMEQGG